MLTAGVAALGVIEPELVAAAGVTGIGANWGDEATASRSEAIDRAGGDESIAQDESASPPAPKGAGAADGAATGVARAIII